MPPLESIFREYSRSDAEHSDRSAGDRARHRQKVRESIRENIADIIAEESIIGKDRDRVIKVPLRGIKEYRFIYGENAPGAGQGQGDTSPGQVVGKTGKDGQGKGDGQAADRPESMAATGCKIDIEDDGTVVIASADGAAIDKAIASIQAITAEPEVGRIYKGRVRKVVEFGAFVEIMPGTDGLLHISQLSNERVRSVEDVVHEGDEINVKVLEVGRDGKIRLSLREAQEELAKKAN